MLRIPTNSGSNNSTRSQSLGAKVNRNAGAFSEKTKTTSGAKESFKTHGQSPISKQGLLALASDLRNGLIDRDQANTRFVGEIVSNSLGRKLSEKDCEILTKDIAEFFGDDKDFVRELEKNLKALA